MSKKQRIYTFNLPLIANQGEVNMQTQTIIENSDIVAIRVRRGSDSTATNRIKTHNGKNLIAPVVLQSAYMTLKEASTEDVVQNLPLSVIETLTNEGLAKGYVFNPARRISWQESKITIGNPDQITVGDVVEIIVEYLK